MRTLKGPGCDVILILCVPAFTPAEWSFEDSWTGQESYVLIPSSSLWQQNLKLELLQNSPLNVHYIFLSNLDSNKVTLKVSEPNKAGLIIPYEIGDDEEITMLVMPVMLNDND